MFRAIFYFVIGATAGSIATVILAVSGLLKVAGEGDVNFSIDLAREDVKALAEEVETPSGEPFKLSEKGATATCSADPSEPCKISFRSFKDADVNF